MTEIQQDILPRIPPSRCKGKFDVSMLDDVNYVAEEKLDGSRYMLYLETGGAVNLYSRRDFPRIEKSRNVPHIARAVPGLEGTILDGEIRLPHAQFLTDTTGIMNMLPERAAWEQHHNGWLTYTVFDILYLRGHDMRRYKYRDRRIQLANVVQYVNNPYIRLVTLAQNSKSEFYDNIVAAGGEGIILKHVNSAYGEGWVKRKKYTDVSCFIIDYQQGKFGKTGKYAQTLGSIILGVYKDGEIYEIGKCSGMDDATRDMIWNAKANHMYKIVDVRAQEMSSQGHLREPRFIRFRDDLSVHECTFDAVQEALRRAPQGELYVREK